MNITILAFGIAKDILGGNSVELFLEKTTTIEDLKVNLEQKYPRLKQLSSYAIAVNNEYAKPGAVINPGDEIAIIPPVSGG